MLRYELVCRDCKKLFSFLLSTTRKGRSSARTAGAGKSSSAGPPSAPSRRRKAPDNGICGHCTSYPKYASGGVRSNN